MSQTEQAAGSGEQSPDLVRLYQTAAMVWADEFMKVVESGHVIDRDMMVGWFVKAIETAKNLTKLVLISAREPDPFQVLETVLVSTVQALHRTHGVYVLPGGRWDLCPHDSCVRVRAALEQMKG